MMKQFDYVLSIDPSGSFNEGLGTTGWVLGNKFGRVVERGFITARNFNCAEEFWRAHNILIAAMADHYHEKLVIVVEDFLVYADKAQAQIHSRMETCRLLGAIQVFCWESGIPLEFQRAVDVKSRWSNEILSSQKIIISRGTYYVLAQDDKAINKHEIDALRHMLHYSTYKIEKQTKPKQAKPKLTSFYNYHDRAWEGEHK